MRLLLIIGPPAVDKMTVGRAVADHSTFRLFHNHHTTEMLLDVFDCGTPAFRTLNSEFRRRVEGAAASGADWPRRSRSATSTGPTPTFASSRPSTG